uniref:Uncharacterized protein n=1 Tax=Anguilla anguilla TaxID=7936 RepID=A0A0E9UI04_ANGAN
MCRISDDLVHRDTD